MRAGCSLGLLVLVGCSFDAAPLDTRPTDCAGLADGTLCSDRNRCTVGDACLAEQCVGGEATTCSATEACRGPGTCDPLTGQCGRGPPLVDGAVCDDGDLCTDADVCLAGACLGRAVVCEPMDACHLAGTCDPATGGCLAGPAVADGSPCEDGDLCTSRDFCQAGSCQTGEPVNCAEHQCATGVCDPADGRCTGASLLDGTPCDDLSACSDGDVCLAGSCVGTPIPCETTNSCETASCDPINGCLVETRANGSPCEDGNLCTTDETCSDGACGSGVAVTCVAPQPCVQDGTCDPAIGCIHPPQPDGFGCDDGDLCTFDDGCLAGVCEGTAIDCSAPTPCHQDGTCNQLSGTCAFPWQPNDFPCNDQNACTQTDVCRSGQCVGTDPIVVITTPCEDGICFDDVTVAAGITWTATISGSTHLGAGGAFLDYDGDGWLDLLVGAEQGRPSLFRNLQNGTFADVTVAAQLPEFFLPDRFMGFAVADYDNDGDPDIYLLAWGGNRLMRNDGGLFVDVTGPTGTADTGWSTAAAFGDYDGDGDLDLYVGNYIAQSNFPAHTPFPNRLLRNDGGIFTDVTTTMGVGGAGTTLAVSWTDFDDDGDVDLLVCNDFGAFVEPNRVYVNSGGALIESASALGADIGIYCMGITAGDYDRDGDFDYYFSNLGRNVLLDQGTFSFTDVTGQTGTGLTNDACFTLQLTTSWGVGFQDFDQDGWVDLYVSNGHIPAAQQIENARLSPNALFRNAGASNFLDISRSAGIDSTRVGRGVAFGDYDRDGDVDILQVNVGGPPHLYQNVSPALGAQLAVDVRGRRSTRDAHGARVEAHLGAAALIREVNRNYSYMSASSPTVHFGLGTATMLDALVVRYLSGTVQTLHDVPTGMSLELIEPHVTAEMLSTPGQLAPGTQTALTFELHNAATTAETVDWDVTTGSEGTTLVPAGGAVSLNVPYTAPTSTGGFALTVTVSDASGAVDQARISSTVQ